MLIILGTLSGATIFSLVFTVFNFIKLKKDFMKNFSTFYSSNFSLLVLKRKNGRLILDSSGPINIVTTKVGFGQVSGWVSNLKQITFSQAFDIAEGKEKIDILIDYKSLLHKSKYWDDLVKVQKVDIFEYIPIESETDGRGILICNKSAWEIE